MSFFEENGIPGYIDKHIASRGEDGLFGTGNLGSDAIAAFARTIDAVVCARCWDANK